MMEPMQDINLDDYTDVVASVMEFKVEIFKRINSDIFIFTSFDQFYPAILLFIDPINKQIESGQISVLEGLKNILLHFGIYDIDRKIKGHDDTVLSEEAEKQMIEETFRQMILELDEIPIYEYHRIRSIVEDDLLSLNKKLKYYESLDFINRFKNNWATPRNHKEKTMRDFYLRTRDEQEVVLEYFLTGISERALYNCKHSLSSTLSH